MTSITNLIRAENVVFEEILNSQIVSYNWVLWYGPIILKGVHWLSWINEYVQLSWWRVTHEANFREGEHTQKKYDWEYDFYDESIAITNLLLDLLGR
jgi:hypothetical protein